MVRRLEKQGMRFLVRGSYSQGEKYVALRDMWGTGILNN